MNELKLDINIDKDVAQGRYANLALIAHTKNEFILDFALLQPQGGALVVSRIVTSPQHAKALLRSLAENIARYEEAFGPIPEPVAENQAWSLPGKTPCLPRPTRRRRQGVYRFSRHQSR